PLLRDRELLAAAPDRRLRETNPRIGLDPAEIGIGDRADQRQRGRARCGFRREILSERGIRQIAHAAPEIELEGWDGDRDRAALEIAPRGTRQPDYPYVCARLTARTT